MDGDYLLEDGEDPGKFIQIRVRAAYLRPQPAEAGVYLQAHRAWDLKDITAAEASAGAMVEQDYVVENHSGNVVYNTRAWIDRAAPYLTISVNGGGSYSQPKSEAEAVLLAPGGGLPPGYLLAGAANNALLRIRRTIPAGTKPAGMVPALLHLAFDGV